MPYRDASFPSKAQIPSLLFGISFPLLMIPSLFLVQVFAFKVIFSLLGGFFNQN